MKQPVSKLTPVIFVHHVLVLSLLARPILILSKIMNTLSLHHEIANSNNDQDEVHKMLPHNLPLLDLTCIIVVIESVHTRLLLVLEVKVISVVTEDGWMDERCFRPLFCSIKAELGLGQEGLMR